MWSSRLSCSITSKATTERRHCGKSVVFSSLEEFFICWTLKCQIQSHITDCSASFIPANACEITPKARFSRLWRAPVSQMSRRPEREQFSFDWAVPGTTEHQD